ncbi:SusD/RagB family nutrient-binding outer membrane lipoprotein [Chitinophaga cymbidii]|uniref:SusD/RagB family nutrient-binding outer membrane lipoprotein n=1 Tax=Chitinophaga cymbidii TaxID=1096750 RepID=A0A512RRQ0_9BACT|nr:SusD/RagB family nutrient-binding outer membrane lipoprotein [Chitinophaga cymbidii]GEP98373.1 hypothetical protein CCY01nite_46330 [Chitinophaga cymbidii]
MKKNIIYIICLSGLLAMAGCKDYLDINTNPNLAAQPPIDGLLASTTYATGNNTYRVGNITSYFVQHLASPTVSSGSDIYDEVDYNTTWRYLYDNMTDIHDMIEQAKEKGSSEHLGVGLVLMAINLQMATDLWGNIPYSEAFVASSSDPESLTPPYDSQEEIYNAALQLLTDGIAELSKTDSKLTLKASQDLIHGGDLDAWKRTANLIKARLLNHYSRKGAYNATNVLTALSGSYTGNSQDAQVQTFPDLSPWNQAAVNNTNLLLDGWISAQLVDAMDGTDYGVTDPRLPYMMTLTQFGDYRGTINGAGRVGTGTDDEESYLSLTGFYSKPGAPVLVATFAEAKFIEAEANFRSNKLKEAYDAYLAGIAAHMDKLGVPGPQKTTYINNPAVSVGEANITLALIMKEKYIAMFLHPEAWTDARRFDYQYRNFTLPTGALLPAFIRRVAYPSTEISRNAANVPPVENLNQKLWWDE